MSGYDPSTLPFGSTITSADVLDSLEFLDDWESRYSYIIDLGRQLAPMPDALKTEARMVRGCQSQVWLETRYDPDAKRLWLGIDSDALIVKGLAAMVLAAYNGKSPADILAFDIEGYFAKVDLMRHLSQTRGNGLRSMVKRIQDTARTLIP
ncbi:MAG: SufE family protein [Pseudomonadota bacterium]